MSIQKISPDDIESFTLETNPYRTYISSSNGITGSVYLFARRSSYEKEIFPLSLFKKSEYNDDNLENLRKVVLANTSSNITDSVLGYLFNVNEQQSSVRKEQKLEIYRFEPPSDFNSNTLRKKITTDHLMPYYRTSYPNAQFAISNYNCLNFYTASNVPSSSVLLYPNPIREGENPYNLSLYGFSGSFSFDFWIKPKYTSKNYKAGTIAHLTGAYCLSLHTGSSVDLNGYPDAFKLVLQLTNSANIPPSLITSGQYIFSSSKNAIKRDEWNHVTVRWGGPLYNNGTGSILINSIEDSLFTITNSLIFGDYLNGYPSAMSIGNYYEGGNSIANNTSLDYFFTQEVTEREGLKTLITSDPGVFYPPSGVFDFTHPLNAEIQEFKIYDKYLFINEIKALNSDAPKVNTSNLLFYLPPFFTEESPYRKFYLGEGGIPITPFQTQDGSSKNPFSVDMAFSVGGLYMNLENYVRDFVTGNYPRLWALTCSLINTNFETPESANTILYNTGSNIRRLFTILPSDNGKIFPNYEFLNSLSSSQFKTDNGTYAPGYITLRNLVPEPETTKYFPYESGSFFDQLVGPSPGSYAVSNFSSGSLAIVRRTKDTSSNQVAIFDISNLFYGKQIKPGTFSIIDTDISSSAHVQQMILKDDGLGNLYRADAKGIHATWSTVGNIFYNEGIVIVKSPQLTFFGKNEFEIQFQGVQDIHVMTINAFARSLQLISSSNTSYTTQSIDTNANNTDPRYVYITSLLIHDDNLNVIARTNVAQPVLKYSSDKFLFKFKMDW